MKDPLKQGLKHSSVIFLKSGICVEVKDPLKQGLKPTNHGSPSLITVLVEVKDPLKQGLKLNRLLPSWNENGG